MYSHVSLVRIQTAFVPEVTSHVLLLRVKLSTAVLSFINTPIYIFHRHENHTHSKYENTHSYRSRRVVVIVWWLNLQLPMQSVPITTDVASSNHAQGEVYNIM